MSNLFQNANAQGNAATGNLSKASYDFPNPWLDYASTQMPNTNEAVLKWCEYIWYTNGTYKIACERIISYFLTDIEFEDASDDEKEKYEDFLKYVIKIVPVMATIGNDFLCYGNSFTSLYVPFRRYLRCDKCKSEWPLDKIDYKFKGFEFHGECANPKCKCVGKFTRVDRKSKEKERIKVIRWSPHQIKIINHPISDSSLYLWDIPEAFKKRIKEGDKHFLENTPWEIIEAIQQNKPFQFNDGVLYHMKENSLSGVNSGGWGISRLLSNFRQAYYIQILKRYNEALAMDYIVPFRVITPATGNSKAADPLINMNMGNFSGNIQRMLLQHRRDPATWHTLPFPVTYQALASNDAVMIPQELLGQGIDELLNAIGVPVEFYNGNLQTQAAPVALRLFQQTWSNLVMSLNGWLEWLLGQISVVFNWEKVTVRLTPSSMADDVEKRAILLQLAAGQQVSRETAFKALGIDVREEIRRVFEEQALTSEEQKKFEEQQQSMQSLDDAMSGGGQGGQGGQQGPSTPADLMAQAEQIAGQLLSMPESQRRTSLNQLKKSNETLYAAVKSKMQDTRNEARSQGGQQVMQQNFTPQG